MDMGPVGRVRIFPCRTGPTLTLHIVTTVYNEIG